MNPKYTGIVNGSKGRMHSLTWECGYEVPVGYTPGARFEVPIPYSVNIMTVGNVSKSLLVPCLASEFSVKLPGSLGVRRKEVRFLSHHVQLAFSTTFHKIQGQSVDKLLVILNERCSRKLLSLTAESVYVALTRVEFSNNLRLWPVARGKLAYLKKLTYPKELKMWSDNYDANGYCIPDGLDKVATDNKAASFEELAILFPGSVMTGKIKTEKTITVKSLRALAYKAGCSLKVTLKKDIILRLQSFWFDTRRQLSKANVENSSSKRDSTVAGLPSREGVSKKKKNSSSKRDSTGAGLPSREGGSKKKKTERSGKSIALPNVAGEDLPTVDNLLSWWIKTPQVANSLAEFKIAGPVSDHLCLVDLVPGKACHGYDEGDV